MRGSVSVATSWRSSAWCSSSSLVLVAIFADLIAPYGITERDSGQFRSPPSCDHLFGTDIIGRDVFSRVVYGSRVSLRIGVFSTVIAMIIGIIVGSFAGFTGGKTEGVIMRFIDMFLAIPYIVLAIAVATVFGRSENSVILVLGLTGWLAVARIVRSTYLQLKKLEYVEAAHALGFGRFRIMYRHILPNALQPIIVFGTIAIGSTILAEAALSFLGVGPQDPTPAWGLMISQGKGDLANAAAPHPVPRPRDLADRAGLRVRRRRSARRTRPEAEGPLMSDVNTIAEPASRHGSGQR